MDSLRKTYCPPARGYIAASSPYARAPRIVTTPDTIHAISSQNGELTVRAMSAATMKMPEPIIEPATSMVASVSVSALTNSRDDAVLSAPLVAVVVVKAFPGLRLRLGVFLPLCGRNVRPQRGFCQRNGLENYLDLGSVPLRRTVGMDARSESHRAQNFGDPLVVVAIASWIESNQLGVALLVHVEKGLHVKALYRLRRRHRRDE